MGNTGILWELNNLNGLYRTLSDCLKNSENKILLTNLSIYKDAMFTRTFEALSCLVTFLQILINSNATWGCLVPFVTTIHNVSDITSNKMGYCRFVTGPILITCIFYFLHYSGKNILVKHVLANLKILLTKALNSNYMLGYLY